MPRRPMLRSVLAGEEVDTAGLVDEIENLRQGTRDQYESGWTLIQGASFQQVISFSHGLNEIPLSVDVMSSTVSDGKSEVDANSSATVTKTNTTITLTNTSGADLYFKVRAM